MFCFLVQISLPSLIKLKASRMVIAYDIFSTKTCRAVPLIFFFFLEGVGATHALERIKSPAKHARYTRNKLHVNMRDSRMFRMALVLLCGYRTKHMANRTSYCRSKSYCQQKERGNFLAIFASRNISLKHRATEVELRLQPPKTGK